MHKLFFFVIALAAHAYGDNGVQRLSWVTCRRKNAELCTYNCTPGVQIDGNRISVTFTTTLNSTDSANPAIVYQCMHTYMNGTIGDAVSSYTYNADTSELETRFTGDYDCNLLPPPAINSLATVLQGIQYPMLGGQNCTRFVYVSPTNEAFINIGVPATDVESCYTNANIAYNYLIVQNLLDKQIDRKVSYYHAKCILELWSKV